MLTKQGIIVVRLELVAQAAVVMADLLPDRQVLVGVLEAELVVHLDHVLLGDVGRQVLGAGAVVVAERADVGRRGDVVLVHKVVVQLFGGKRFAPDEGSILVLMFWSI